MEGKNHNNKVSNGNNIYMCMNVVERALNPLRKDVEDSEARLHKIEIEGCGMGHRDRLEISGLRDDVKWAYRFSVSTLIGILITLAVILLK